MAFNRQLKLSIGADGSGLDISNLHIAFSVTRSITFAENTGEFTIYNMKKDSRSQVLTQGNNIVCAAGYEDEYMGTIFIGYIIEALSQQKNVDNVTKVVAASVRSNRDAINYISVSLAYSAGTSLKQPLKDLANAANVVISGVDTLTFSLPNGWVYAGSLRGALDYMKQILLFNGYGMYIDNAEIIVYNLSGDSSFGVVYLTYQNGLLEVTDITKADDTARRISFKSLLIPKIQPNGILRIDTPDLSGAFSVDNVRFYGDNFGGDFFAEGECTA